VVAAHLDLYADRAVRRGARPVCPGPASVRARRTGPARRNPHADAICPEGHPVDRSSVLHGAQPIPVGEPVIDRDTRDTRPDLGPRLKSGPLNDAALSDLFCPSTGPRIELTI
jgi:hypothetical protein